MLYHVNVGMTNGGTWSHYNKTGQMGFNQKYWPQFHWNNSICRLTNQMHPLGNYSQGPLNFRPCVYSCNMDQAVVKQEVQPDVLEATSMVCNCNRQIGCLSCIPLHPNAHHLGVMPEQQINSQFSRAVSSPEFLNCQVLQHRPIGMYNLFNNLC